MDAKAVEKSSVKRISLQDLLILVRYSYHFSPTSNLWVKDKPHMLVFAPLLWQP